MGECEGVSVMGGCEGVSVMGGCASDGRVCQ